MSRHYNTAARHVWESNDDIAHGLDPDVMKQAETDMGGGSARYADLADRRASVLCSFIQGQNDWLFRMAQEMRQELLTQDRDQGDNVDMVQIPWRRWAEFSTGVMEQARHTQRMLRSLAGAFSSKTLDLEQNCSQLETMLARYELQNAKLLRELGHQQKRGIYIPPLDSESSSVGIERNCLCQNGCRCWSSSLDPVLTISQGWLKNDDLRLHRRILNEQRLLVERQSHVCIQQEAALEKWSQRFKDHQRELVQKTSETEELKAQRDRLQRMLREKMDNLQELRGDVDASQEKVLSLSIALQQTQVSNTRNELKLFKYDRLKAAHTIQRTLRQKLQNKKFRAVLALQQAARHWLKRKRRRTSIPSVAVETVSELPLSDQLTMLSWEEDMQNDQVPQLVPLLSTLHEIETLEMEHFEDLIVATREDDRRESVHQERSRFSQEVTFDDILKRLSLSDIGQL